MRIENLVINCTARYPRTCRRTPFEVVVYELNYSSEDKDLMDLLIWGIERSGFFNGREKWAKGFENQRV